MTKLHFPLLAVVVLLWCVGCAHDPVPDQTSVSVIDKSEAIGFGKLSIISPDPDRAYTIFGTTDQDIDYYLYFDEVGEESFMDEWRVLFRYGENQVFVINKPPGKYKVSHLVYFDGFNAKTLGLEMNFCLRPGAWTYVGDLILSSDVWGGLYSQHTKIYLLDKQEATVESINAKFGKADRIINKSIMTPEKIECENP